MAERPYSRVYWSVMDDERFDTIRGDVRHLGSWTILLIVADMAYPAPALVPKGIPPASLRALAGCGLIEVMAGNRYRIHGLASEREMRAHSARNAAAKRWHSGRNAEAMLDETSIDKTSKGKQEVIEGTRARPQPEPAFRREFAPQRPGRNTVRDDPELRAQHDAQVARYGPGMDEPT
jgi:hypothetical protein